MPLEADLPPGCPWVFDAAVAGAFDDMLARSIPQLAELRRCVSALAAAFVPDGGLVVDLGVSNGGGLEAVLSTVEGLGRSASFLGVDDSPAMLRAAEARLGSRPNVSVRWHDLRDGYPVVGRPASVTTAVLTLQFLPVHCRASLLASIRRKTEPGGALVVVEKVVGPTPAIDRLFVEAHHGLKRANGYSAEEVERKRLALDGVLVPLTATANETALRTAGFDAVECFWRWMNFAGWLAVRRGR
jgi:tRNA (cmo5U34)-methyltransferase